MRVCVCVCVCVCVTTGDVSVFLICLHQKYRAKLNEQGVNNTDFTLKYFYSTFQYK